MVGLSGSRSTATEPRPAPASEGCLAPSPCSPHRRRLQHRLLRSLSCPQPRAAHLSPLELLRFCRFPPNARPLLRSSTPPPPADFPADFPARRLCADSPPARQPPPSALVIACMTASPPTLAPPAPPPRRLPHCHHCSRRRRHCHDCPSHPHQMPPRARHRSRHSYRNSAHAPPRRARALSQAPSRIPSQKVASCRPSASLPPVTAACSHALAPHAPRCGQLRRRPPPRRIPPPQRIPPRLRIPPRIPPAQPGIRHPPSGSQNGCRHSAMRQLRWACR